MIDLTDLRNRPEVYKEATKQKGYNVDIDKLLELDVARRQKTAELDALRQARNELSANGKNERPSDEQITQGRELKERIVALEQELAPTEQSFTELLNQIPNPQFSDVPIGGEDASVEIKKVGETNTGAIDHLDFAEKRDWVDFERGAKVAGAKFYYLKGDLALLENAVIQYALDVVTSKGFTFLTVPHLVNSRTATGTGFAPRSSEQSDEYYVEGEDLSLIATAEMPITGYHADEILDEKSAPFLYVGLSPCYRKEAGAYGKHNRGLFRVHQFNKLEMYAFTTPEQSAEMHERILAIEEEIWQAIGIPYRIINIASGDLGAPAAKKYDIEYWSPVDDIYRELTSCSNCTDYQTRNLGIRIRKTDGSIEYAHSLNGTAVSTARTLVAIIEHFQTEDGQLRVPNVLQKYLNGRELL